MSDKNLTENEIKRVLEHCASQVDCNNCILFEPNDDDCECSKQLKLAALDLINRQKSEKQELEIELQAMRGAANSYKTELENLDKEIKNLTFINENLTFDLTSAQAELKSLTELCQEQNAKINGLMAVYEEKKIYRG